MIWNVCFGIALALLAFAVLITALLNRFKNTKSIYGVFAGMFMAVWLLFLPINCGGVTPDSFADGVQTVLVSLHNAVQTFTINVDAGEILESIKNKTCTIQQAYSSSMIILVVLSPVLTFSFVLSFFKNVSAHLKLIGSYFNDMYIFSELNDKSLALAKDIKKNHKKAVVIFTKTCEENARLIEKTYNIDAICFKEDILSINFKLHSPKKTVYLFAMGEDEKKNVSLSVDLISKYNDRENTKLYVFSSSVEGEFLLLNAPKGRLQVRKVNPIRSAIYNYFDKEGYKLFKNYTIADNGDKVISVAVIGFGKYGKEFVKALAWFCHIEGYRIDINVFDGDKLAEEKFTVQVPALMSKYCNGVYKKGQPHYNIKIHSGSQTETKEFTDKFTKLTDTSYVFVALGSDEENIKHATYIRMLTKRMGINPVIKTVVYDSVEKVLLTDIKSIDEKENGYEISFIGDFKSLFSEENILKSDLEQKGFKLHKKYSKGNKEQEIRFWDYDYYYSSSIAIAIRTDLRNTLDIKSIEIAENMPDEEKAKYEAYNEHIDVMEHCGWDVYMRTEGYIYGEEKNHMAKTHPFIKPFADLDDDIKEIDARMTSSQSEVR